MTDLEKHHRLIIILLQFSRPFFIDFFSVNKKRTYLEKHHRLIIILLQFSRPFFIDFFSVNRRSIFSL